MRVEQNFPSSKDLNGNFLVAYRLWYSVTSLNISAFDISIMWWLIFKTKDFWSSVNDNNLGNGRVFSYDFKPICSVSALITIVNHERIMLYVAAPPIIHFPNNNIGKLQQQQVTMTQSMLIPIKPPPQPYWYNPYWYYIINTTNPLVTMTNDFSQHCLLSEQWEHLQWSTWILWTQN